jgi:hypothetical protein
MSDLVTARDFQTACNKIGHRMFYSNCDAYVEEFENKLNLSKRTFATKSDCPVFDLVYVDYDESKHGALNDDSEYAKFTVWYNQNDIMIIKLHKWDAQDSDRVGDTGMVRTFLIDYRWEMQTFGKLSTYGNGELRVSESVQGELSKHGLLS